MEPIAFDGADPAMGTLDTPDRGMASDDAARAAAAGATVNLYVPTWQSHELPVNETAEDVDVTWVLLCTFGSPLNALGDYLRNAGESVMTVWPGGLAKLGHDSEAALLLQPELEGRRLRVVLSSSYFAAPHSFDSAELASVCHQAARTVTTIAGEQGLAETWLVTEAAQAVTDDENTNLAAAALWGLFKTALSEYPGRFAGLVDVSSRLGTAPEESSAAALVQLCKGPARGQVLALRKTVWYREQLACVPASGRFQPRANVAYLVTSAFGEIGFAVVRHLLRGDAGGLILQGKRQPSAEQARQIEVWRAQGARMHVLIDTLSAADSEQKVIGALDALGLPLGGIFHLAAAREDVPLAALDYERWAAPMADKHDSLPLLRHLARHWRVEALVYFSTVSTILGSAKRASHIAANAVVEAIAREDRRHGLPAICILWGPWVAGTAQRRPLNIELPSMETCTTLAMLDAAVVSNQTVTVAAQADWRQLAKTAPHLSWLEEVEDGTPAMPAAAMKRTKLPAVAFILSAPRSGSTLLRAMLANHTRLFTPPELHLLQFDTLRQRSVALADSGLDEGLVRAYVELTGTTLEVARRQIEQWVQEDLLVTDAYATLQRLAGQRMLVDKSPSYAMNADALADIENWFEGAKYVHLTRDPHAMIESFQRMRMYRIFGEGTDSAQASGEFVWSTCNRNLLKLQTTIPAARWFTLSYEHLVQAPPIVMRDLCEFLEIPFEPAVLTPQSPRRILEGSKADTGSAGDLNFTRRHGIVATLAQVDPAWRVKHPLSPATQTVAGKLGYTKALTQTIPWLSGCRESWVEIGGRRASLCQWGSPAGEPVLILHGWQDQAATWAAVARNFADAGYRVFAPDLRQHGRDRDFTSHRPSVWDLLGDVLALLQGQRLKNVHVVGHSLGAVVAALLAVAHPASVASLALVEPLLPDEDELGSPEALRRHIAELSKPLLMIRHDSLQAVARRLQYGFPNLPGEALQALAGRIAEPDGGGFVCPTLERGGVRLTATLRDLSRARLATMLQQLESPVLWLRGTRNTDRREADDRVLQAMLPTADIRDIDGGHHLHVDAPNVIGAVLADFFSECSRETVGDTSAQIIPTRRALPD